MKGLEKVCLNHKNVTGSDKNSIVQDHTQYKKVQKDHKMHTKPNKIAQKRYSLCVDDVLIIQ